MDELFRPVPEPVIGGYVVIDSTQRFGERVGERGQPCHEENATYCGGRLCFDPRGQEWIQVYGPLVKTKVQADGHQLRAGPLKPGSYTFEFCPYGDARDRYGVPLRVLPGACGQASFEVN